MHIRKSLLALALVGVAAPAAAQTFSNTIFFGDSLTDSGTFRPALVSIAGPSAELVGRFTTNPYLVWSEQLANRYGIAIKPSNQGGTNYAVGGARAGVAATSPFGPIPSVQAQVTTYLSANSGRADPNALYAVWAGGNDLLAVMGGAPATSTITSAVGSEIRAIGALAGAGAKYIMVPTLPDLGLTPTARAGGAVGMATATAGTQSYNNALYGGLKSTGINVIPVDTFNLLREVTANAAAFGYTNTTGMACGAVSSLQCAPPNYVAPNAQETYLFADGVHPTGKTHTIMADLAYSMIEGPRQVGLLPLSTINSGVGQAQRVMAAGALSPTDGARIWVDARGNYQNYDSSDVYKSNGGGLLIGANFSRWGMTFGPYVGFNSDSGNFGRGGGGFDQKGTTIGGQMFSRLGHFWSSSQISYTKTSNDIDRNVKLGPVTRVHSGSADGSNLIIASRLGLDYNTFIGQGGPFASIISQRVRMDGYAESDPALSTALGFDDVEIRSGQLRLGWQNQFGSVGNLQPYASVAWVKERADLPSTVSATSLTTGMKYRVPGVQDDDQFGEASFGVRTQVMGHSADVGISASLGRKDAQTANVYATFAF